MTDATERDRAQDGADELSVPHAARAPAPERATTQREWLVPLTRAPSYASTTWGPYYYEALHPPCRVNFIINWKVVPKAMERAAELWRRRQDLRRVVRGSLRQRSGAMADSASRCCPGGDHG